MPKPVGHADWGLVLKNTKENIKEMKERIAKKETKLNNQSKPTSETKPKGKK